MDARAPCKLLEWDTAFFGARMAMLSPGEITSPRLRSAVDWCRANSIACLYVLSDANDANAARVLHDVGAREVDVRMTYGRDLAGFVPGPRPNVRSARAEDIPYLRDLAAKSHTNSRFWADAAFSRERCAELYATWIEKSCRGWCDAVLVPELDGRPVGYLSIHVKPAANQPNVGESKDAVTTTKDAASSKAMPGSKGEIGLVAIDPIAQGRGLGGELLDAALAWFLEHGLQRVIVVTQGRNMGAQRLYQSRGFQTDAVQQWHHLWLHEENVRK